MKEQNLNYRCQEGKRAHGTLHVLPCDVQRACSMGLRDRPDQCYFGCSHLPNLSVTPDTVLPNESYFFYNRVVISQKNLSLE